MLIEKSKVPEVVALGYYDGPTEGIARSIGEFGPCYFKTIAWDEWEDVRLYAICPIGHLISEELLANFFNLWCDPQKPVCVLTPEESVDEQVQSIFDQVAVFKSHAWQNGFFVLGESPWDSSMKVFQLEQSARDKVEKALSSGAIEDLSNWESLLESD